MLDGLCLVISPLIALMSDQVEQLRKRGIMARALYSGMPKREIDVILDNCIYGKVKFLYVSPERLGSELFIERLKQMDVTLLAVDEAHCISQWGYDFRPSYLDISSIYPFIEGAKKIALTATATREVKEDIIEKLMFQDTSIFQKSFARKNLSYAAFQLESKSAKTLEILKNVPGSAIIYVRSRKDTENIAKYLYQNGVSSDFYHAGLDSKFRAKKQEDWISGIRRVMVATNAFGMGIDKPDVRCVIHWDLPDSLEAYYQEAGRAGRDERRAYAVLIYAPGDLARLEKNEKLRNPDLKYIERVYQAVANHFKLATGSSQFRSFDFDIKAFSHQYDMHPAEVYHAINKIQEMGLWTINESMGRSSALKILISSDELYRFAISNARFEPVLKAALRLYGGALYSDFQNISEYEIARLCKSGQTEIGRQLTALDDQEIVIYDPVKTKPQLTFLLPRLEISALKKYHQNVLPRQKVIAEKVKAMLGYAENNMICRSRVLQEYFDEEVYLNCGVCDICLSAKKQENREQHVMEIKSKVLEALEAGPTTIAELRGSLDIKDHFLLTEVLRELMDAKSITIKNEAVKLK